MGICLAFFYPYYSLADYENSIQETEDIFQEVKQLLSASKLDSALAKLRQAEKLYRHQKDSKALLQLYSTKADIFELQQNKKDLAESLVEALLIAEKITNIKQYSQIKLRLAQTYLILGQYTSASPLYIELLESSVVISTGVKIRILNDLGIINTKLSNYEESKNYLHNAIQLAQENNQTDLLIQSQINLLLANVTGQKWSQAENIIFTLYSSLKISKNQENLNAYLILAYHCASVIYLTKIQNASLKELCLKETLALEIANTNTFYSSSISGSIGRLYWASNNADSALEHTEKALFQAQTYQNNFDLFHLHWLLGRIQTQRSEIKLAIESYKNSIGALTNIKTQLEQQAYSSPLLEEISDVYMELAGLLLDNSKVLYKDSQQAIFREVRNILEQQKETELRIFFQDSCVNKTKSKTKSIDKSISPDTVVIYPIILKNSIKILLSHVNTLTQYTVPVKREDVKKTINLLRQKLEKRKTRQYLPFAKKLYNWIVQPLIPQLEASKITTLVFVPDQLFRLIPLSSLHNGNHFLIQRFSIAVTPGIELTDLKPINLQNNKTLLSGISYPVQGFNALNYVESELSAVSRILPSDILINENFSNNNFITTVNNKPYNILHIASHGVFTGQARDSFLLTFNHRMSLDNLESIVRQHSNEDRPVELLTLSACQTAAGDQRAALGLAGITVKAGASSALATLWPVNDRASAMLVTEFYRQLKKGKLSKAQALRNAQLSILGNIQYRHPGFWAPFLMIGNWL